MQQVVKLVHVYLLFVVVYAHYVLTVLLYVHFELKNN